MTNRPTADQSTAHSSGDSLARSPQRTFRSRLRGVLRVVEVRLRLLVIFLAAFLIVGKWDVLRSYWERLTAPQLHGEAQSVSADTEYFCPMDPGVISDWPSRCPVCNMGLVRRAHSEMAALPDGVLARMQFSPYRLQLAGVRTIEATWRRLDREIVASGCVVRPPDRHRSIVAPHAGVVRDLRLPLNPSDSVERGKLVALLTCAASAEQLESELARWALDSQTAQLQTLSGGACEVRLLAPITGDATARATIGQHVDAGAPLVELHDFSRVLVEAPLAAADAPLVSRGCPVAVQNTAIPSGEAMIGHVLEVSAPEDRDRQALMRVEIDNPDRSLQVAAAVTVRILLPLTDAQPTPGPDDKQRPAGQVLCLPESAVIDNGDQRLVYVESAPGMFDAVEVKVGPRSEGYYPVLAGLKPGQRVAAAGAFLIDAETHLNPSLAAGYFGATRQTSGQSSAGARPAADTPAAPAHTSAREEVVEQQKIADALAQLPKSEQALAQRQKVCPVTGLALGSMGRPPRVTIDGRSVFICCRGCEDRLRSEPEKFLQKLSADTPQAP